MTGFTGKGKIIADYTDYAENYRQKESVKSVIKNKKDKFIQIESNYNADIDTYDDFLFRNVRLEYIPEPATLFLLGLGGLALRRKRRA